jgi:hypothetical protein
MNLMGFSEMVTEEDGGGGTASSQREGRKEEASGPQKAGRRFCVVRKVEVRRG